MTGAASGMGLATAEAFAKAGAAVVLADFKEEVVRTAAYKLADRGHKAIAVGCVVSDDAQVAGLVGRTIAQFGGWTPPSTMLGSWPASSRQPAARARTGSA